MVLVLFSLSTTIQSGPQVTQQDIYPYAPPVYTYEYSVNDPSVSGSVFSVHESRNDLEAAGDYRVSLPDGRTQVVSYTVSGPQGGYVASVEYEGEAAFPHSTVKAAPVQAVGLPVSPPISVHKPIFHSVPLNVAPTSHKPLVHAPVIANPSFTPFVHNPSFKASPVVFHSSPKRYSYKLVEKSAVPKKEERKGKKALVVEENSEPKLNTNLAEESPVVERLQGESSPPNIEATTPSLSPSTLASAVTSSPLPTTSTKKIIILPEVTEDIDTGKSEDLTLSSSANPLNEALLGSQSQYYFKFL